MREDVIGLVSEVIESIHQENALAAVHCCGNTEWSILIDGGADIVSFDAFKFGETISMYTDAVKELLDSGKPLPDYLKKHPVYYAGPAKTPPGKPSGSFGPTTAGRMDSYVDLLQKKGGSMVMIAKGNRSQAVTYACRENGCFYLGSIGGPAALLAEENIKQVDCIDYPELGMEAVWKIEVQDFPAFILVDDKGNDFFKKLN